MLSVPGKKRMSKDEVLELMRLRSWTKTDLASALGLTEHAVIRWVVVGDREPSGPAAVLMRMWLDESRAEQPRPVSRSKGKRVPVLNGAH